MPNQYFSFKQFTVWQQHCAMKVTTDACLFGAWTAQKIKNDIVTNILDIGTGTGLLSLMLAQQHTTSSIDAVEIDSLAAKQALANFQASNWCNRLQVFEQAIQAFQLEKKYNLIITNPPFFEQDLRSSNTQKNLALHSTALSFENLVSSINRLLADDGRFAVLLPINRVEAFITICDAIFYVEEQLWVKQTSKHAAFRSILVFSRKKPIKLNQQEMTIKHEVNNYSPAFKELLQPYYLNL